MLETDHKRLAEVRSGRWYGRHSGKTFSVCHYAADWLLDEDSETKKDAAWLLRPGRGGGFQYIFKMLCRIMEERGVKFFPNRALRTIVYGNNTLRFLVAERGMDVTRGIMIDKTFQDHFF